MHSALAREKQVKGWRRGRKIALIEQANPLWEDLASDWYDEAALGNSRFLAGLGMTPGGQTALGIAGSSRARNDTAGGTDEALGKADSSRARNDTAGGTDEALGKADSSPGSE